MVDPVFNHTMVYDGIRDVDLTEACVELTVWDRDKLATNLLGGVRLGIGTGQGNGKGCYRAAWTGGIQAIIEPPVVFPCRHQLRSSGGLDGLQSH